MVEAFWLALPGVGLPERNGCPLPWPMTWPMFLLDQDGARLPGTLSELHYLDEPTPAFWFAVAS
jgi:hypothetical protein